MTTVSVIIPTRNYGRYLRQAVDSVRRQTWTDWRCLIVDDGSTDDTERIVKTFEVLDSRIAYLPLQPSGLSAARNAGLLATDGDFVQFLDADDFIGPAKIERQLQLFFENPATDIVYGDVRYFRDGATADTVPSADRWIEMPPLAGPSGTGESVVPTLLQDNIMAVQSPLIRRAILDRVEGFAVGLRGMEDWECWLRCALSGAAFVRDGCTDPEALSYVRLHGGSMSQDQIAMLEAALTVRQRIQPLLTTEALRRLNQLRSHQQLADLGILEGLGGHPGRGIRYLLKAGLSEQRPKWLAWALLVPILRQPAGRRVLERWRRRQAGESSTIAKRRA